MGFLTVPCAAVNSDVVQQLWDFDQITTAGWWDLSDSSKLFDAVTGGNLVVADGEIARIEDKSGNARHFKQATSINRAIRKIGEVNGLDVGRLDGTDDGYTLDTDLSITSFTIFFVFRPGSTITASSPGRSLFSGGDSTSNPGEFNLITGSVTGNITDERLTALLIAPFIPNPSVAQAYGYGKADADISATNQTSISWNNSSPTFAGTFNGSSSYASLSAGGGFDSVRKPTKIRFLGYRGSSSSFFWNGDILEFVVVPSVLNSTDLEKSQGRLAHKWGTTASLPGGHPYKTVPPYV